MPCSVVSGFALFANVPVKVLQITRDELHTASVTERLVALRYATVRYQKALHGASELCLELTRCSLSETECCIATRQNKMTAPNVVNARFTKLNVFLFLFFVLGRSGLCINDHRTQNQSLKQAPLVFLREIPSWKIVSFWQPF